MPGGEERGGHAFKGNQEFIVALSGAFDVVVDDGQQKKTFSLNRSYYGLYVPAGLWREINNFSTNSLALEFGSEHYTGSGGQELLYTLSAQYIPSKIVIHA